MSEKFSPDKLWAKKIAKKALGITGRILIELIEQCEDFSFLYYHHWAGSSQSIRADRYDMERRQEWRAEYRRKQAIRRLKKAKFIKAKKVGDRAIYILTESGKVKALEVAIRSSQYVFADRLCVVSFDFPEAARHARNHFRYFLKKAGFRFVQGSVWSMDRDVSEPIICLIKILRIRQWVKVYLVSEKNE